MKINLMLLGLVGLALAASPAAAQSEREGTAGASYLLVPVTAKTTSLGVGMTAGMANTSGVELVLANPAGLASATGTEVLFSRMEYAADIGVNYIGVGQRFGNNTLGLTLQSWDYGDIVAKEVDAPDNTETTFSAGTFVAGLSLARQFTDRIAAGTTVKVLSETIDDMNASGIALDAGMTYTVGESGLRFGVSLNNLGRQMKYDGNGLVQSVQLPSQDPNAVPNAVILQGQDYELPSLLNFGIAYTRALGTEASLTALGNFRSNSFTPNEYSGGLELGFRNILYVRGGYQLDEGGRSNTFFKGYNLGAGLNLDLNGTAVSVDYAFRPIDYFGNIQMVTASLRL